MRQGGTGPCLAAQSQGTWAEPPPSLLGCSPVPIGVQRGSAVPPPPPFPCQGSPCPHQGGGSTATGPASSKQPEIPLGKGLRAAACACPPPRQSRHGEGGGSHSGRQRIQGEDGGWPGGMLGGGRTRERGPRVPVGSPLVFWEPPYSAQLFSFLPQSILRQALILQWTPRRHRWSRCW